jgi:hypothetical protein
VGWGGQLVGQFGVAGLEQGELLAQVPYPGSGGGVVHGAVLERRLVAGEGRLDACDPGLGGGQVGPPVCGAVLVLGLGAFDHGGQDGFGLAVEGVQRVQDQLVDLVGG